MNFQQEGQQFSITPSVLKKMILHNFQVPVIIKNSLTSWKSIPWTLEEWAKQCEAVSLDFRVVSRTPVGNGPAWEAESNFIKASIMQFKKWSETSKDPSNPLFHYLPSKYWCYSAYNYMSKVFSQNFDILKAVDWKVFGFDGRCGVESTFWIGSNGAYTPCHLDTYGCNLVAQICGRKKWILFPPEDSCFLYPTRIPYEESSIFSSVNILNPDLCKHSLFEKTHPHIVVLEPGDVLFVPKHWWHFVQCLDTAVSINTWLELDSDDENRMKEAVTKALMTALIPIYQPNDECWLNPFEELVSPEETLSYISSAVKSPEVISKSSQEEIKLQDKEDCSVAASKILKKCQNSDVHTAQILDKSEINSLDKNIVEVKAVSFSEYENEMGITQNFINISDKKTDSVNVRDIINCFVHPEVVSLISEKLKEINS